MQANEASKDDDFFKGIQQPVRESAVKLLRAVSEIVGGDKALAERLGIREALLTKFMSGKYTLPDPVLFRAVDLILEDRESRLPLPDQPAVPSARKSEPDA